MIVNGKEIAKTIQDNLLLQRDSYPSALRLAIIYAGSDPRIEQFMRIKERFGKALGIEMVTKRLSSDCTTKDLLDTIDFCAAALDGQNNPFYHGIVVQLPLPDGIDRRRVLDQIPIHLDCDVLSARAYKEFQEGSLIMPPVAAAIKSIIKTHKIELSEKHIVVVGNGELVGKPVVDWLRSVGLDPVVCDRSTTDMDTQLAKADIIISGAGQPHLITPEKIKTGCVLFDAGTSDSKGGIQGDIDPVCAEKAQIAALVPGGIGPITVAQLYQNFFLLLQNQS